MDIGMFLPDFVCLSVCDQDNSKSYGRIFLKFCGNVGHSINYKWFNFEGDPAGILDSGSLWNFRYHCVTGGIREPVAKWIWWCHLANNIALAEVPAGYDRFLVSYCGVSMSFNDFLSTMLIRGLYRPRWLVLIWCRPTLLKIKSVCYLANFRCKQWMQ